MGSWEIVTWEVALGEMPLENYLAPWSVLTTFQGEKSQELKSQRKYFRGKKT